MGEIRKALDLYTDHRARVGLIAQESDASVDTVEALMDAIMNVKGALSCLERGDPRSAVWRLIDAAGVLADKFPVTEGDDAFTGLGFKLVRNHPRPPARDPRQLELFPS